MCGSIEGIVFQRLSQGALFFSREIYKAFEKTKEVMYMEHYELSADETVLFKGNVTISGKEEKKGFIQKKREYELILTNHNIVFVSISKGGLLKKESYESEIHPLENLKVYDNKPQVIRRDNSVQVYMTDGELFLDFENDKQAKEFTSKCIKEKSGESKFVRAVKTVQNEYHKTLDALNIDEETVKKVVVGTAKVISKIGSISVQLEKDGNGGKVAKRIASATRALKKDKETKELPTSK